MIKKLMAMTAILIGAFAFSLAVMASPANAVSATPSPTQNAVCSQLGEISGSLVCTKIDSKLVWDAHKLSLTAVVDCKDAAKPTATWTFTNGNKNRTAKVFTVSIAPGASIKLPVSTMSVSVPVELSAYGKTEKVLLLIKGTATCPSPSPTSSSPKPTSTVTVVVTMTPVVPATSLPVTGSKLPLYAFMLGGGLIVVGLCGLAISRRRARVTFRA